jgi:hypothetical protein
LIRGAHRERIFDLILKTASGQPTKSENFDFGGAEFVPWALGGNDVDLRSSLRRHRRACPAHPCSCHEKKRVDAPVFAAPKGLRPRRRDGPGYLPFGKE